MLRYDGKRGTTWSIKYRDASDRQVRELLGPATEGWTRRKAQAALRARLTDVARDGYRKPEPTAFEAVAREWLDTYPDAHEHRRTTRADYRAMVENHFVPAFRGRRLGDVTTAEVDAYVAAKRRQGFAPRTLTIHLTRLHSIFDAARRQGLVQLNPVSDAEPAGAEVALDGPLASRDRGGDAGARRADRRGRDETERAWRQTTKAMTMTIQYAWLRRGELLGLCWRDVEPSHPDGPRLQVRETFVRGHRSEPKTDDGARTIALDEPFAEELWKHRRRTRFAGDDDTCSATRT